MDEESGGQQGKSRGRRSVSRRSFVKGAAVGAGLAASDLSFLGDVARAASNAILTENAKVGSSGWDLDYVDDSIEGFAADFSVNAGEPVRFKINTVSTNYRVDIYRIGWYGGAGARLVTSVPRVLASPQVQPAPIRNAALGLVDCGNWAVSATWNVPATAVSGVYVANFVRLDVPGDLTNRALFVVRNDGRQSDILVQTSDTTYQAYNRWGGNSLYHGDGDAAFGRAVKVSYSRPMEPGQLENDFYYAEMPLVRWLERNGYDVTYASCIDTEQRPAELRRHKVFVSSGHDEYWSSGMRANVEAARDAGVHLIFMTGNEVFWKVRWESSIDGSGAPYKTLVCYKETLENAKVDPSPEWTGTWRDGRFSPPSNGGQPENGLTGTLFKGIISVDDTDFPITVPYEYSRQRFWRNTSVAAIGAGQSATLTNATLGYEFNTDGDLPARPAGLIRLSETTVVIDEVLRDNGGTYTPGPLTHYMTMYRAASGALVWSTGTVQWSWGLDDYHTNRPVFAVPTDARIQQATLNMLADMGVQPASRQAGLVAASASTDFLPPVSTVVSPAADAELPIGTGVTLMGTATDAGGGRVAAVEVSIDGGASWHPALGRESWTYSFVPQQVGSINVKVRAIDDSGNIEPTDAGVTYTGVPRQLPGSLWNGAVVPALIETDDATPLELGVRFSSSVDAFVTGLRFYKGPGNVGQHVGRIWSAGGALLGSTTFTNETASGWQTASFSSPVSVKKGTTYVASYTAPNGRYPVDVNYFESAYELAPLRALANGDGGGNGVFSTTPGSFPTSTFGASNYWVDPILDTNNHRAPTLASTTPAQDVSQVGVGAPIRAVFSEPVVGSTVVLEVAGPGGAVAGQFDYDDATRTASFTPDPPLEPLTQYVATVVEAVDLDGTSIENPISWTFTTVGAPGTVPTSIWTGDDVPATTASDDPNAVELGVKFRSSVAGFVTGVRFYKGEGNGGTHLGRLWSAAGELLAATTFTDESATGWQEAAFDEPVAVDAGTLLVASYLAPEGHYAVNGGFFSGSNTTRGPLTAVDGSQFAGNGVYRYGADGGFPAASYANGNYWVDVVFTRPPDLTPPLVESTIPAANLQAVAVGAPLAARFDKAVDPASVTMTVSSGSGTVNGVTSYDSSTQTATFTASAALAAGTTHTVSVTATSTNGSAMAAAHSWSFTTATPLGETPATLWDTAAVPATAAAPDSNSLELGLKFRADVDGAVTGVRFYKGAGNVGQHIGHLWSDTGTLLGTAVFTSESDSGWQQANFPTPIPISAGTTYVASYFAPAGNYSLSAGGLSSGVDRSPLHALASASAGGNGVFVYGAGAFPAQSYGQTNYWVDVVFVDVTGPSLVSHSPTANAVGVEVGAVISARFNENIQPSTASMELRDAQGAVVSGSIAYDVPSRTLSFTPSAPLGVGASYTATVAGARDAAGNQMSPTSWAFTTIGASSVNLFGNATPSVASASDNGPLELGMRFRATATGQIHGVRFHKGPANTGTHLGRLWTTGGVLLAETTFVGETASGWQYAPFPAPVNVAAGTDLVVSYYAPSGGYSVDGGYFGAGDVTNGPLVGLGNTSEAPNGLFLYANGGGFPSGSWNAGNYWVDVEFSPT